MSKVEDALEVIKGMTILELRDLNKAIEEEFGVTAAAPVAMASRTVILFAETSTMRARPWVSM